MYTALQKALYVEAGSYNNYNNAVPVYLFLEIGRWKLLLDLLHMYS